MEKQLSIEELERRADKHYLESAVLGINKSHIIGKDKDEMTVAEMKDYVSGMAKEILYLHAYYRKETNEITIIHKDWGVAVKDTVKKDSRYKGLHLAIICAIQYASLYINNDRKALRLRLTLPHFGEYFYDVMRRTYKDTVLCEDLPLRALHNNIIIDEIYFTEINYARV